MVIDGQLRRTGDTVAISGAYQHDALLHGGAVRRFWHFNKQLTIARYLPPAPTDVVVDVGCGSGVVSDFLAQSGARVIGIDANADAIHFARRTYPRSNLRFEIRQVDDDLDVGAPVDKVYCLEVIEHLYPGQALEMVRRCHARLAPGGRLYLTTPNARSVWPALEWTIDRLGLTPRMAGAQHVARYSRGSIVRLCEQAGFDVERVTTTCLVAPWVAALNWAAAIRVNAIETGRPAGCILVCIARKRPR